MQLKIITPEIWKMDGGAGFGLVPKTIWSRSYPADDLNYIFMTSRLLLIEDEDRKILIDTGYGNKRTDKYYKFKFFQFQKSFREVLGEVSLGVEDITDVIITHLHDDHVGGATYFDGEELKLRFPNATHWISKAQWDWAMNPNKREAGSFFKDNFVPIKEASKLNLIEEEGEHIPNIEFRIYNGHTQGNMVPIVKYKEKQIAFMGDFIPYVAAIPLPFISANDIQPLFSLSEKEEFLNEAADKGIYMFYEHDYYNEVSTVEHSFKRVVHKESFKLSDIL
jgi:glyoxylase-like metal-dependent hydrolase (beta-lactamase superfamily II)